MPYTIRYNARTVHLEGIAERTTGAVSYYAQSACAALTRSGSEMSVGESFDTAREALSTAQASADAMGRKVCKNCEKAAKWAITYEFDPESEEFKAEKKRLNDELIARSKAASAIEAETAARHESDNAARQLAAVEHIDPAVAAAGRASTFGKPYTAADNAPYTGCEARIYHNGVGSPCGRPRGHELDTEPGTAHRTTTGIEWMPGQTRPSYCPYARTSKGCDDCKEHAELVDRILACGNARTYTEAEALAVAMEEEPEAFAPLTVDPEAAYAARRAIYRTASDLYEEHGGEANRDATAAAWNAFVTAARAAGKCIAFTCYADAEPGADHCQRHRQHVTARLDHTEPGKAIALIGGDHGREHAPQAWLAHEGGSWLLVDDYDGDTLNVKGPDAERAVHAWAALLGLRIDALAVEVEYAGGPVSPPVREPEGPVPPLNWVWAGSGTAADVFEARGRAHDYQVTEHVDAAGASLVAFLRGTTVDTYRRGYMTADDARKAAEHYEARYGSVYVPAE